MPRRGVQFEQCAINTLLVVSLAKPLKLKDQASDNVVLVLIASSISEGIKAVI